MTNYMNIADIMRRIPEPANLSEEVVDAGLIEGRNNHIDSLREQLVRARGYNDALKWVIELLINNRE